MKAILFPRRANTESKPEEHPLLPLHEPEHDTSEGGEFLDDAIRTEEQPVTYTEESIAPGSPHNLL